MRIVKRIDELKSILREENLTTGFVPTMGYLHDGHLSLVKASVKENKRTVVSIYVNPSQFGAGEDLDKYPRNLERDIELLEQENADILFMPDNEEMYPAGYLTWAEVDELDEHLCGASRPGHFRGVVTIVLKLFNIVRPDRAYMGLKDAQQYIIIKKMVRDLNLDVNVVGMPLVRDTDGLALSSRNRYLSVEEREQALVLSRALKSVKENIDKGVDQVSELRTVAEKELKRGKGARTDYLEFVSVDTLKNVSVIDSSGTLVALAVKIGKTRLIDNLILGDI